MGGPNLKLYVKLENETKKSQGLREGYYIACNHVAGRHWVQQPGKNAIWFDEENKNWKIGHFNDLGSNRSGLRSIDSSVATREGPEKATIWKFHDSQTKQWKLADITIKAIGKFTICNFGNLASIKLSQHDQIHSTVNFCLLVSIHGIVHLYISSVDQSIIFIYFLTQF